MATRTSWQAQLYIILFYVTVLW